MQPETRVVLQSPGRFDLRFSIILSKNPAFWDVVKLCGPCKNRRLLVTANAVPSSLIIPTLMIEAILSSETSVLRIATWRHIPGDGILHSHVTGDTHMGLRSLLRG
jgi:hypothetical protein